MNRRFSLTLAMGVATRSKSGWLPTPKLAHPHSVVFRFLGWNPGAHLTSPAERTGINANGAFSVAVYKRT